MIDLCFYIWLCMYILDDYIDFSRMKSIKSEKSVIVKGRYVRIYVRLLPSFLILKHS